MTFREWLESQGAQVGVYQPRGDDDYECWYVTLPDGTVHDITYSGTV